MSYYDCFEKVLPSETYYYCSLVDYVINMSKYETWMLLWIWLVHNLCWKLECCLYIFATTRSKRVCKSFFYHFQFAKWIFLRTSKGLSLGELIYLQRMYFPNTFVLVLGTDLHDLDGTNPDWRCFQQNCHGVIFVQKLKFSEWPENQRRIFLE